MSVSITRTPGQRKEFLAVFTIAPNTRRIVRFGTSSNYVTNSTKTDRDRDAYIARHKVRENFEDPMTPGALSRWILWGESRSITKNIQEFRKRFDFR
jgi:hypothetical protein